MDYADMLVALIVILLGAELFTNGVEWIGEGFGLSEGAVGSVLAAVGTALPETVLPVIAILGSGAGHAGDEIGIGAILGAPFMLSTLTVALMGISALSFARTGRRGSDVVPQALVIRHDLAFFLPLYALALAAGIVHARPVHYVLAPLLVVAYVLYVRRHFAQPEERELEAEAGSEVRPLYGLAWIGRLSRRAATLAPRPPVWASVTQTVIALLLIVGGARLFVDGMHMLADRLGLSPLVFSLLVAPVATELPEKFNSVLWLRRRKDTLAFGNVTGAMVFQSTFPVAIGMLLTPWRLTQEGLISGAIAIVAGVLLYATIRARGSFAGWMLVLQGSLYVAYVGYVLTRI